MTTQNTNSTYQQQYDALQHFDKMSIDLPWNDKDEIMDNVDFDNTFTMENKTHELKAIELQNLSHKMSQLSTNITNEKQFITKNIQDEIEKIPDYLTKRNQSFRQILYQAVSTITTATSNKNNNTHIESLRHIAILIYKIMFIQIYHALWATYLKSGMGQLITPSQAKLSYSTTVSIWPKQIKILSQLTNGNKTHNEHEFYLKFVDNHLHELDQRLKQFQTELNLKAKSFQDYTLTIQKIIETYIEQNLQSLRMEIAHQIELIHYDYHIQSLKLEYFRYKPNAYQEQLMKQICQSKYDQETTEQEYHLLKQKMAYYNLPNQSFECSPIASCPLIDSIENPIVRQELFKQYKEIAEQSRAALFNVYLQSAEDQREEYKKKYEADVNKMSLSQHSLNEKEKISSMMIQLINERCNKISERIKCIYKFKAQSFLSNS